MKKVIVIILVLLIVAGSVTGFSFFKSYKEKEEFFDIAYNTVYNESGDIKSYTFKGTSTQENENIIQYMELYYDGINKKTLENYKSREDGYIEYKELIGNSEIRYYLTYGDDVWFKEVDEFTEDGYSDELNGQIPDMALILDASYVKKIEDNVYEIKYNKEYLEDLSSEDEIYNNIAGKVYIDNGYVVKVEIETISNNVKMKNIKNKMVFELNNINSTIVGVPDDIKNSAKEVSYEE